MHASILVLLVVGVTGRPDAVVGDIVAVLDGGSALSPLEVEDVVGHVVPVLASVLRIVELFVDSARLVHELSAGRPGGRQSPRALRRVEEELLDALARVETLNVAATVLRNPVDSVCTLSKVKIEKRLRGGMTADSAVFDTFE